MKASGAAARRGMRVLSPRMLPPESALEGSTASTATFFPRPIRWSPKTSMKVLFPTPGTPLTPTRAARPVPGSRSSRSRCAARWWSARVLSTSVIAFASARRLPARTSAASASGRLGADGGMRQRASAVSDQLQHPPRGLRDLRARAEDRLHAGLLEEGVVLGRDDVAAGDHDVTVAEPRELLNELRHERLVAARLGRDADHVHVVLDRLARDLLGRLEEHAHVDVEAQVGEGGGDHLGAAVVAVLADLGDQHAGAPPVLAGEALDFRAQRLPFLVVGELAAVDAGDGADLGVIVAPDLLDRARDLAHRGTRAGGVDREREEVPLARLGGAGERVEGRARPGRVARLADALEPRDLGQAHGGDVDGRLLGQLELVHPDDHVLAPVDARLAARGRLLDAELGHPRLDRLRHAAHRLDLLMMPR